VKDAFEVDNNPITSGSGWAARFGGKI